MSNSFFDSFGLGGLLNTSNISFFDSTDVKTILGRNLVKNFVGKIKFELSTLGYSDTANDIAEFYQSCCKSGGIVKFVSNPVIKMILDEVESTPSVKFYLKDRIFDDIEVEKAQSLDKIFESNDELFEKTQHKEHEYKLQHELRRKAIKKIQKEKNCTFEEAEKIYELQQKSKEQAEIEKSLVKGLNDFLGTENPTLPSTTQATPSVFDILGGLLGDDKTGEHKHGVNTDSKSDKSSDNDDTQTVSLDDDVEDGKDSCDSSDGYWF